MFSQKNTHLEKEVLKLLRNETNIQLEDFPIMSIAIIEKDTIQYLFFNKGSSVDNIEFYRHYIYEIGEMTQIFTAYLFYHLQLQGMISSNDSLSTHLNVKENPLEYLIVDNLLMNTTGLPNKLIKDVFDEDIEELEINSIQQLVDLYNNSTIKFGSHSFNNYDYSILGYILKNVSGSTYLEKLNEFLPIDSRITSVESLHKKLVAGHNRIGDIVPPMKADILFTANGIKTSIQDLSNYIQFLMVDSTNINYFNFVMEESVENSRFNLVIKHRGWNSVEVNKSDKVLLQQGKTDGFTSFVAIYPRGEKAIVLLTNSSNSTEGLGFFILRMVSNFWKTN